LRNYFFSLMTNKYDASQIKVLEGLEPVRRRPGMYIGSTDSRGLHHLITEVIDNSVDESLAGYAQNIWVTLKVDNSASIEDDGRGIPVDKHPSGLSALEVAMTKLHAGGKFDNQAYKVSGGLHGVGASVVNALSAWMTVQVCRHGKIYQQQYERGIPKTKVEIVGKTEKTGTKTTFLADEEIFKEIVLNASLIKE